MADVSSVLNNREIGFLADLFLAHLGLDRSDLSYRRIKNAVILLAVAFDEADLAYAEIAATEDTDADVIKKDIEATLDRLPAPPDELFNKAYAVDFMPRHDAPSDTVAALGKTFLYLLETNYPEYRFTP